MHKKLTSSNKSKDEHKKVQHDSPGAGFDDIDSYKQKVYLFYCFFFFFPPLKNHLKSTLK